MMTRDKAIFMDSTLWIGFAGLVSRLYIPHVHML